jgi:hypothetical protein
MAHFARLENNIIREIIVINNEVLKDENGVEQESIGAQFCADTFGGEWKQTSYNGNFRGRYAGNAVIYDAELDEFISQTSTEEVTE